MASPVVLAPRTAPARVGRTVWFVLLALVAWQSVRFVRSDALPYFLDVSPDHFRHYWPNRWALLLHITGGIVALLVGPFQFWTGLRRRSLALHRLSGRVYVASIFLGGAAALWLTPATPRPDFGVALAALAAAWWTTTGMAFVAAWYRRIDAHKAWMIRSYVVTLGFVSFRYLIELSMFQPLGPARASTVAWLAWVPALLITEVVLQWRDWQRAAAATRASTVRRQA